MDGLHENVVPHWLPQVHLTVVSMEATGVYWKPVWNILEAEKKFELLLINAQHIKHVPGRKTDQKDSEWIADLLQHGLLRASFVPPEEIRRLRDLTRLRTKIRQTIASFANRIQKVLEDANIKLGSVASDVLGLSGRHMLNALIAGEQDSKKLAQLAQGHLRKKTAELQLALEGHVTQYHRLQLKLLLEFIDFGERQLSNLDAEIQILLTQVRPQPSVANPPDALVAAAEKRRSGKTRKGSVWLRRALCQAAWAASRTKNTYLAAQYRRLILRKGKNRTIVAVAHSMLIIAYHLVKRQCTYQDLGADYFNRLGEREAAHRLVKKLINLGYYVTLQKAEPQPQTA